MTMLTIKNLWVAVVFILCAFLGSWLSSKKALWNDELYTQVYSIQKSSYGAIISGDLIEGNNTPLYYLIQKAFLSMFNYHLPYDWKDQKDGRIFHPYSQFVLRLLSVVLFSCAIALIFRYFLFRFSLITGLLSVFTSLSSLMVLSYMPEARPYALWFFLTVVQLLVILRILESGISKKGAVLSGVHCLLALTSVLSIGQIFIAVLLIFFNGEKKYKSLLLALVLPVIILGFYMFRAFNHHVYFPYKVVNPLGLINDAFSLSRLLLLTFLTGVLFKLQGTYRIKDAFRQTYRSLTCLAIAFLSFSLLLLIYLKFKEIPSQQGMVLNSRYFIFLTPLEIVAVTYIIAITYQALKQFNTKIWKFYFTCTIICFYIIQAMLVYKSLLAQSLFPY